MKGLGKYTPLTIKLKSHMAMPKISFLGRALPPPPIKVREGSEHSETIF